MPLSSTYTKKGNNKMSETKGYIYILTNPSFPQYVKIGYADNVEKRLDHINIIQTTLHYRVRCARHN